MTEGISQEAREAARSVLGQSAWDNVRQSHDSLSIVQAMQSLINSTIERCAAVADAYEGTGRNERCDDPQVAAACDIATAIRQMKGSTNV